MSEKEEASLAFPVTCMLISFAFTIYLHRTWTLQQIRAFKRFTRHVLRRTKHLIRRWARQLLDTINSRLDETAARPYNILEPSPWDTDTSSNSLSELEMGFDSATNTASSEHPSPHLPSVLPFRPACILDSTGRYILNRAPESLPRPQWEVELAERIRNGRGPAAWLDRTVDWVVRQVVTDFHADMRAEIDRVSGDRCGMPDGMVQT
ncbi:hypothetical protein F1880_006667 [Penicillium rolfsii]|nr:hypothetical protein F1880_006667 [Penicillium rolfsii]